MEKGERCLAFALRHGGDYGGWYGACLNRAIMSVFRAVFWVIPY